MSQTLRIPRSAARLRAPYHLINTALNIQGRILPTGAAATPISSCFHHACRQRGDRIRRDIGGREGRAKLDLATAMAISGLRHRRTWAELDPLTPTALLNVRLLAAKSALRQWAAAASRRSISGPKSPDVLRTARGLSHRWRPYRESRPLLAAAALPRDLRGGWRGRSAVELPCAGHCERYARIDLGMRIDLPWEKIADVGTPNRRHNSAKAGHRPRRKPDRDHPHCAVGRSTTRRREGRYRLCEGVADGRRAGLRPRLPRRNGSSLTSPPAINSFRRNNSMSIARWASTWRMAFSRGNARR